MSKISNKDLVKKEPYRSIMMLLTLYPDGLGAKHFIYALSKKRDSHKGKMEKEKKEMEKFLQGKM